MNSWQAVAALGGMVWVVGVVVDLVRGYVGQAFR